MVLLLTPPPENALITQGVLLVGRSVSSSRRLRKLIGQTAPLNEAPQKRAGSRQEEAVWPPQGATDAQQHDRRAGCGGGRTPVICRPETAGSLPELRVGE